MRSLTFLSFFLLLGACAGQPDTAQPNAAAADSANVVEIVALSENGGHRFDMSTHEVASGWTTLRFTNRSPVEHFALMSRVPDSLGVEEYREQVAKVAQNLTDAMVIQRDPSFPDAGMEIGAWYADVIVMGGPGLASPGAAFETTVDLAPGTYVLECYVRTPEGMFHHVLGMLEEFRVTDAEAGSTGPTATLHISLRNDGMTAPDTVATGTHTVEVLFEEQQQYPNLTYNDVHVVKLDEGTDLAAVATWLDWMTPGGLTAPGAPAQFVGGTNERLQGERAWFTLDLAPGRYAWIAEVPDPAGKGLVQPFVVTE